MSDGQQVSDASAWHRKFAAACNNRAWELSVQDRGPAQDREMLPAAEMVGPTGYVLGVDLAPV